MTKQKLNYEYHEIKCSKTCECKLKSRGMFIQHANEKVPVIHVNRFRNQFFLLSALSKVIFHGDGDIQ